jgi:predicted PurR-regulated permease PerM
MNRSTSNRITVLLIVLAISVLFFAMVRGFVITILFAGLLAALAHPIYRRVERLFKGRRNLASLATLFLLFLIVLLPLGGLFGIVAQQAFRISHSVQPWVQETLGRPWGSDEIFKTLPFHDSLYAYKDVIFQKGGELVGIVSNRLFSGLSSATLSTVTFLFHFVVFLYSAFFFMKDGPALLDKMLYYLPLPESDQRRLLDKFTSVARATLKGTFLIGIIQGTLAGLAFAVIGIESAVFWGTLMTVLAMIPGLGTAFVWVPASIILAATGHVAKAVGLAIFCILVVGTIDNILRPRFVGRDTQLHPLLIFLGTIGGIALFGIAGFLVGPIVAALFVTAWDIYGETFKGYLSR